MQIQPQSPLGETFTASFQWVLSPYRPSKLLGKRLRFERSTALGFSPDTFLRVLSAAGVDGFVREHDYNSWLALRAHGRSITSGTKPRRSTLAALDWSARRHTRGKQPRSITELEAWPNNLSTPWRLLNMSRPFGSGRYVWKQLLARFAFYDRVACQLGKITDPSRAMAARRQLFEPSALYWMHTPMKVEPWAALCIDATLHHIAWLDSCLASRSSRETSCHLIGLASPPQKPMRHWFKAMLRASGCRNLLELEQLLLRRNVTYLDRGIDHSLLKKWSSSQVLLPRRAESALLQAAAPGAHESLRLQVLVAQVLTFLAEAVRCFGQTSESFEVCQMHMFRRLTQLRSEFKSGHGPYGTSLFPC